MIFDIYKNGKYINGIVGDEDFTKRYCLENGYTYKIVRGKEPDNNQQLIETNPHLSEEKINAVSDRIDFLEDCIAEMATQVYNN